MCVVVAVLLLLCCCCCRVLKVVHEKKSKRSLRSSTVHTASTTPGGLTLPITLLRDVCRVRNVRSVTCYTFLQYDFLVALFPPSLYLPGGYVYDDTYTERTTTTVISRSVHNNSSSKQQRSAPAAAAAHGVMTRSPITLECWTNSSFTVYCYLVPPFCAIPLRLDGKVYGSLAGCTVHMYDSTVPPAHAQCNRDNKITDQFQSRSSPKHAIEGPWTHNTTKLVALKRSPRRDLAVYCTDALLAAFTHAHPHRWRCQEK